MSLEMESQVVGATKASVAVATFERLRSRVLAVVSGQLVRPGEPPLAALPGTSVRLLTCMCSLVSFQVGALRVDFLAVWKATLVDPSLLIRHGGVEAKVCF